MSSAGPATPAAIYKMAAILFPFTDRRAFSPSVPMFRVLGFALGMRAYSQGSGVQLEWTREIPVEGELFDEFEKLSQPHCTSYAEEE